MLNKTSKQNLPESLQQLGQIYTDRLSAVNANHAGTYHEPLLKQLYANLAAHVDHMAMYKDGTFPSLATRLKEPGDISTIQFARSPHLTRAYRDVMPNLAAVANSIINGNGGCFSIDPRRRSGRTETFPSYDNILGRNYGPSGNRSITDWQRLFDQQKDYIHQKDQTNNIVNSDWSSFGTCNDGMCQSCPTCMACGEEILRSISAINTSHVTNSNNLESLYAPAQANSVHMRGLITTSRALSEHLLHLGSTEDTKDDSMYRTHGLEHGNASSMLQSISLILRHGGTTDYEEQDRRGGFPVVDELILPKRPRLTIASDPMEPAPYGTYNLGKEQRRKKNK